MEQSRFCKSSISW